MKSKTQANSPAAAAAPSGQTYWILMILSLAVVLYARIALLGMPLERDEGGYAYIGERLFGSELLY